MFVVSSFADENPKEWAEFVEACPEAWLGHRPESIRGTARDCSFALRQDGRLAAICVVDRMRDHLGWVLDGPGVAVAADVDADRAHLAVGEELRARARSMDCAAVRFDLPLLAPANRQRGYPRSALATLGFSAGIRPSNRLDIARSYHSIVDLRQDMQQVLKGFSKGNRNAVTRAQKRGFTLTFTCGTPPPETEWNNFAAINKATFARSGLPGFSEDDLAHYRQLVTDGFLALMNIHEGGACIASELLEIYKGGVNCLAGGSTDEARQFGITPFSMYSAMGWAKAQGCHSFNLGSTLPVLAGTRYGGIGESKKRFGGERIEDLCGEWILDPQAHFARILIPHMAHQVAADWIAPSLGEPLRKLLRGLVGAAGRQQAPLGPTRIWSAVRQSISPARRAT